MKLKQLVENKVTNLSPEKALQCAEKQGERIPELEPIIIKDPESAYMYAKDIIKGKWPEAESTIMTRPAWAVIYAKNVIKGRWPEAEPCIMKSLRDANWYLRNNHELRNPSKDDPLILGSFAIMDVPNTITDKQVIKLINIIEPAVSSDHIVNYRTFYEPLIKCVLKNRNTKKITTKQLLNDENLKHDFLNNVNCSSYNDFE